MNLVNYLVASAILLWSCDHSNSEKPSQKIDTPAIDSASIKKTTQQENPFLDRVYFSKEDAEKILGEKAYLSDSSSAIKKNALELNLAYSAYSKDPKSGKTGVVYFMIEVYKEDLSAKKAYNDIKVANENHEGIKMIHDMGDEAYFHSDGQNFYFILVRKERKMFRIKVNKITSHTTLDEFNLVSKKISDSL